MINFSFDVDKKGYDFCCKIANEMTKLFNISYEEAINRINSQWIGQIIEEDDLIYHEDENFWANTIYYTGDSYWWMPSMKDRLRAKEYNPISKRNE